MSDNLAIPHHRIQWRVGSTFKRGAALYGQLLAYVDARTVMERLDILDPQWSAEHGAPIEMTAPSGQTVSGVPCRLTVNGVTRTDVGVPSDMEPVKGAYSDALKRCAVHFGIGRELYEMPFVAVQVEEKSNGKAGKPLTLPTYNNETGLWEVQDSKLGFVRYSEVAEESSASESASEQPRAKATRPRKASSSDDPPASDRQRQMIFARARNEAGLEPEQLRTLTFLATGKRSSKQLTSGDIDVLLRALEDEEMVAKAKENGRVPVMAE